MHMSIYILLDDNNPVTNGTMCTIDIRWYLPFTTVVLGVYGDLKEAWQLVLTGMDAMKVIDYGREESEHMWITRTFIDNFEPWKDAVGRGVPSHPLTWR